MDPRPFSPTHKKILTGSIGATIGVLLTMAIGLDRRVTTIEANRFTSKDAKELLEEHNKIWQAIAKLQRLEDLQTRLDKLETLLEARFNILSQKMDALKR